MNSRRTGIIVSVLIVVFYIGSLPPVYILTSESKLGQPPVTVQIIYAPCEWIYETSPLRYPMQQYRDCWEQWLGVYPGKKALF